MAPVRWFLVLAVLTIEGLPFLLELLYRAWRSTNSLLGTEPSAVLLTFVVFVAAFLIKLVRRGRKKMMRRLRANIADVLALTVTAWLVLISYHLFYKVPHDIWKEASKATPELSHYAQSKHPLPGFWDEKTPIPAVTIKPEMIIFDSPLPNDEYVFTVRNNTDDDVYAVAFKLRIYSNLLSSKDFAIDIPKASRKESFTLGGGQVVGDISGMGGKDSKNNPLFFIWMHRLAAHEYREITLRRLQIKRVEVHSEVAYFQRFPLALIRENNRIMTPFYLDEPMSFDSIIFWIIEVPSGK